MTNKRISYSLFVLLYCLITLFSCKKNSIKKNDGTIMQEIPIQAPKQSSNKITRQKIDIDMTKMSGTMIYAEVFNMLIEPDIYRNKNIKVSGYFQIFESKETNETFYAIIIPDATQCCQQGIEFVWAEETTPEKLPANGQEITITGTFHSIEDSTGVSYTYLEVYDLVI